MRFSSICVAITIKILLAEPRPCFSDLLPPIIGFINLNYFRNTIPIRTNHSIFKLIHSFPSRLVTAYSKRALQTQCTNSVLLVGYIPHCSKPHLKWLSDMKYCSCCHRILKTIFTAFKKQLLMSHTLLLLHFGHLNPLGHLILKKIFYVCLFKIKPFFKFHGIRGGSLLHIYHTIFRLV